MSDRPIDRVDKKAAKLRKAYLYGEERGSHLFWYRDWKVLDRMRETPYSEWDDYEGLYFAFSLLLRATVLFLNSIFTLILYPVIIPVLMLRDILAFYNRGIKNITGQVHYMQAVKEAAKMRDEEGESE